MQRDESVNASDLAGIYKDIAEVIGVDATLLLHEYLQGQQITFPKKLFSKTYILQQLENIHTNAQIKEIAMRYGYTERRIRQILKEEKKI